MNMEKDSSAPPPVARFESKVCEHCQPLRHETNVLVLARLTALQKLADINLGLALASILYFAVSIVLLVVSINQMVGPEQHLVDGGVYHLLDFGTVFLFSIVEVLTLLYSPERRFTSPTLLRILMFFSVCSTFVGLLFIALNRSAFEVMAHNIDYLNDFTVALVDSLLVSTVIRSPASHPGRDLAARGKLCGNSYGRLIAIGATFVPITLSFGQIAIYNGLGVDARGHLLGERPAHVLEFIFDGVGAAINFWFCLDSKSLAEELTRQIMLAPDELVVVIDPESNTSVHTAEEVAVLSPRSRAARPGNSPFTRPGIPQPWHSHSHADADEHVFSFAHDHCCEHDHGTLRPSSSLTESLLPPTILSQASR